MWDIVFEHKDFVVINKPCGVSVHSELEEDVCLTASLAQQLGVERVWLVHRLDKATSGLLLFALNRDSAAALSAQFAEKTMRKIYLALGTHKPAKKQGWVKGGMARSRRGTWKLTRDEDNFAVTRFSSQSLKPGLRLFVLQPFTGKTLDPFTGALTEITAEPATDEEAAATVKVMGGEDWQRWIEKLGAADVLAQGCITVAYSYIGPEATQALYRKGTIGKAKEHLEATAHALNTKLAALKGQAFVSVNKGLVTRASAVIPVIPLYLASLFKVMKEKGTHEGCIEQINRLFDSRLYTTDGVIPTDSEHRIRIDDWELDESVQSAVAEIMATVTDETSRERTDVDEYRHDFLAINGFDIAGIDYDAEIDRFDRI